MLIRTFCAASPCRMCHMHPFGNFFKVDLANSVYIQVTKLKGFVLCATLTYHSVIVILQISFCFMVQLLESMSSSIQQCGFLNHDVCMNFKQAI